MDIGVGGKSSVRLLPNGFAWVFEGKDSDTGERCTVTLRFEFCWFKRLAGDLHTVLDARDHETACARAALGETDART